MTRRGDIARLVRYRGIGVELGVAEGMFSETLLKTGRFSHLFSVDRWAHDRGHDTDEYKRALSRLLPYKSKNTILRMSFDEAVDLFPDEYFDFIYIDGYAHTGQEEGVTLKQWWPKVKKGGVFAGDDYIEGFEKVVSAVDEFSYKINRNPYVLKPTVIENIWSKYPSWIIIK